MNTTLAPQAAPTELLDALDRQLVHALALDGRASFSRLAAVLGVTDQTVVRRYRRLHGERLLRVIGLPFSDRVGISESWLRIQCAPGAAMPIADALARRPDIGWVKIQSGGSEVACVVRSYSADERDALLLQKLPRTQHVTGVTAQSLLHTYTTTTGQQWMDDSGLTEEQTRALARPCPDPGEETRLDAADQAMLAVLARDGRTGYPELARAAGRSESTVRRRLEHLRDTGAIYFDVEILPEHFGLTVQAALFATVAPHNLAEAGEALSRHPEIPWLAAATGTTNLVGSVVCRDRGALYTYVTERIGALRTVQQLEVVPVLRHVKRAGLLTDGSRLFEPPGH
ncbi:Lrp/AsnC family transcriptional regulator [Streptomyces orinoci]|uniref:AsnC family transcriptional regulator n=1 Tax=Streptomyces orinoci TaxID=67339 RepID=A0ABV3K1U2_STRON|nr:AsnC family transcriptional regulator [Streptomyces orinoci]